MVVLGWNDLKAEVLHHGLTSGGYSTHVSPSDTSIHMAVSSKGTSITHMRPTLEKKSWHWGILKIRWLMNNCSTIIASIIIPKECATQINLLNKHIILLNFSRVYWLRKVKSIQWAWSALITLPLTMSPEPHQPSLLVFWCLSSWFLFLSKAMTILNI